MFCENCGKEISNDSRFCEFCGAPVSNASVEQTPPAQHFARTETREDIYQDSVKPKKKKAGGLGKGIRALAAIIVIASAVLFFKGEALRDVLPENFRPLINDILQIKEKIMKELKSAGIADVRQPVQTRTDAAPEQKQGEDSAGPFDVEGIEGIVDADGEYLKQLLSTYERPTLEEFAWYNDVRVNGFWSEAQVVDDIDFLMGGWKGYIVYDPYRTMDSYAQELVNVDISIGQTGYLFDMDWYRMYWEGQEPYDEGGDGKSQFVGSFTNGAFYVTGPGTMSIDHFYRYQDRLYGFGSLLTEDGITADVCLMR